MDTVLNTRQAVCTAILAACVAATAPAQMPASSVTTSFGVDTSIKEVREIANLTRAYLANPDTSSRSRGLWSTKSPFDLRYGDLAMEAYQGFPATIIGVTGTGPGDSLFVVKIIHGSADSTGHLNPIALERLYAVRAPGSPHGWQFSAPLPRLTRTWQHRDFGRITYWYAPGISPSPTKGRQAARFVDSVAKLFSVKPFTHLDAYLTATMDEGIRLFGLDFTLENSGPGTGMGGRAAPGILILSHPQLGEAYLHELVHEVLGSTVESRNAIFGEGVAAWLGGSGNLSPPQLYSALQSYQHTHPNISMGDLFHGQGGEGQDAVAALYGTRALIVDSIYRHSGIPGLKEFARVAGSEADLLAKLPAFIPDMGADPNQWWRTETAAAVKRSESQERTKPR